jgi:hypothetical protein
MARSYLPFDPYQAEPRASVDKHGAVIGLREVWHERDLTLLHLLYSLRQVWLSSYRLLISRGYPYEFT